MTILVRFLKAADERDAVCIDRDLHTRRYALDAMQARLPHAAADERAAIIEWLGRARDAETREVLVAQFHREPNARLKQHIGRFVPATVGPR